jgi:hypothetical protein
VGNGRLVVVTTGNLSSGYKLRKSKARAVHDVRHTAIGAFVEAIHERTWGRLKRMRRPGNFASSALRGIAIGAWKRRGSVVRGSSSWEDVNGRVGGIRFSSLGQ